MNPCPKNCIQHFLHTYQMINCRLKIIHSQMKSRPSPLNPSSSEDTTTMVPHTCMMPSSGSVSAPVRQLLYITKQRMQIQQSWCLRLNSFQHLNLVSVITQTSLRYAYTASIFPVESRTSPFFVAIRPVDDIIPYSIV